MPPIARAKGWSQWRVWRRRGHTSQKLTRPKTKDLDTELLYLRLELLNGELAVCVRSVRQINICLASAELTLCCRGLGAAETVGGFLLRASDAKD